MQRKLLIPSALVAVLALAACSDTGTSPSNGLSAADTKALASDFGDQDGAFLDGVGSGATFDRAPAGPELATTTVTTTFTRTRTCPGGGDVKLAGTFVQTRDAATH